MTTEERFLIPDDAVPYILLQRTETQSALKQIRYLIPYGRELYNLIYNKYLYQLDAELRKDEIKDQYLEYIREEYEGLKLYLPEDVSTFLSIGCGIGGMNIFLAQHYLGDRPDFYLFDKSKVSSNVYYQFNEDSAFYNSLDLAGDVLELNGVSEEKIHLMDADQRDVNEIEDVDLCMSLLSWGFHYPVGTYLEDVVRVLSEDGEMIIDVRQDTDGFEECSQSFEDHEIIEETEKYIRTIFRGPIKQDTEPEKQVAEVKV